MMKKSLVKTLTAVFSAIILLTSCSSGDKGSEVTKAKESKVVTGEIKKEDTSVNEVSKAQSSSSNGGKEKKYNLDQFAKNMSDIKVYDSENKEIALLDLTRGKNTIIMYYTSWCPDCTERVPYLNALYDKNKEDINILFLNIVDEDRESRESGMKYHKSNFYQFPYYSVHIKDANKVVGVTKIPVILSFDKEGKLKDGMIEKFTKDELVDLIELVKKY